MLAWRGRLFFRQYLQGKRLKYGIKFYELCTPDGIILNVLIYTGKGTVTKKQGHAYEVFKKLLKNYNTGHSLFVDNFYTSILLLEFMFKKGIAVTGTLRLNRVGVPKELVKEKLKPGESIHFRKGNFVMLRWKNKRDIFMLSSRHNVDFEEVTDRFGRNKMKPKMIIEYNDNMYGVDRSDQMLVYYSTPRKTLKWYKKTFFHFLDICIWNATMIRSKDSGKKITCLRFREDVIGNLLGIPSRSSSSVRIPKNENQPKHFLLRTGKQNRCRLCYKDSVRKTTIYACNLGRDSKGTAIPLC